MKYLDHLLTNRKIENNSENDNKYDIDFLLM